jgi:glutathione S-transferase
MHFTLYYNNVTTGARACRILLNHLECNFNEQSVDLMKKEQMNPDFLEMNPDHCVPTLKVSNPRVEKDWHLWESRCILKYICETCGGDEYLGEDIKQRMLVDRWLYWDLGSYYPKMGAVFYPKVLRKEEPKEEDVEALKSKLEYLDKYLGEGITEDCEDILFLTGGEVTIADLSLAMLIEQTRLFMDTSDYVHIENWMDAVAEEFSDSYEEVMNELQEMKKKFLGE